MWTGKMIYIFVTLLESIQELALVLICLLIFYVKKIFYRDPRHVRFAHKLQGPQGWPFIGNSLDFWQGGAEGVRKLTEYAKEYGSMYKLWFGKYLVVVMSDAKNIETIFRNPHTQDKPEIFLTPFKKFLGNGLSTCSLNIWKVTRRRVQTLYGKKELTSYVNDINNTVGKFIQDMESFCGGPEFDVCDKLQEITFNAITKSNFGMEFDSNELSKLMIRSSNKVFSEIGFLTIFKSWFHIPLLYYLRYGWAEKNIKNDIRIFTKMVLEKNRKFLERFKNNPKPADALPMPFLSTLHLMQDDETLNEAWLHDQIAFLTAAGTDGVAIMMSFFLISIALNPTIQRKLQQELDNIFHGDDRPATCADLERLVYLDQVLRETERRYTFIPFIFRNVDVDTKIGTQTVPAGSAILINVDQLHHDPKYYLDPFKFNPDNFNPIAVNNRPPLAFIPFSFGPRNCVAMYYAILMMKLTLVALLRKFQFETAMTEENIKINVGFITTCSNGYNVSIRLRGDMEKNRNQ